MVNRSVTWAEWDAELLRELDVYLADVDAPAL
jgi:hypothetical protein